MKYFLIALVFVFSSQVFGEGIIKKIDRSAQESVDEVKKAGKIIIKKMKNNTNTQTDDEVTGKKNSKKKDK